MHKPIFFLAKKGDPTDVNQVDGLEGTHSMSVDSPSQKSFKIAGSLMPVTLLFWSRMTPFSTRLTISRGIAAAVALRVWT